MKVAFFIGHHKTGSTALQSYLASHYLALLQAGILYPAVESKGVANNLKILLHRQEDTDPTDLNIREPHNALGSRLINSHSQKSTVAARAMAERKTLGHLS